MESPPPSIQKISLRTTEVDASLLEPLGEAIHVTPGLGRQALAQAVASGQARVRRIVQQATSHFSRLSASHVRRVVLMPDADASGPVPKGFLALATPSCPAQLLLAGTDSLCAGRSVYRIRPPGQGTTTDPSAELTRMRDLFGGGKVSDASLFPEHRRLHLGGTVLGRSNCSVSVQWAVDEQASSGEPTTVWTLVINSYYEPLAGALLREALEANLTVQQLHSHPAYVETLRCSELSRNALALEVCQALGYQPLASARTYSGMLPAATSAKEGDAGVVEVQALEADLSNEYNVLKYPVALPGGGGQGYAYYDHCLAARTPSVTLALGRGRGYLWYGYDRSKAEGPLASPEYHHAFPLGLPKSEHAEQAALPDPKYQQRERITWGNADYLTLHAKACGRRYAADLLVQQQAWTAVLRRLLNAEQVDVTMGLHMLRLRTRLCYLSSPDVHAMSLRQLLHHQRVIPLSTSSSSSSSPSSPPLLAPANVIRVPVVGGADSAAEIFAAYTLLRKRNPDIRLQRDLLLAEDEDFYYLSRSLVSALLGIAADAENRTWPF